MLLLVLMPVQWYFLLSSTTVLPKLLKRITLIIKNSALSDIVAACTPYFFGISFYAFTKRVSRSCLKIWFCTEFCEYRNKIQKKTFLLHNKLCCPFLCISSNRMIVLSISESLHKRVEFAKG